MPAQESGEPKAPEETIISVQTGIYTGMLIVAAVCMAVAVLLTYLSQSFYVLDSEGRLERPVHPPTGEAGLRSAKPSGAAEEAIATEEAPPAEEKAVGEEKEETKAEEKTTKETKEEAKEEAKEEKPAEEKKEE